MLSLHYFDPGHLLAGRYEIENVIGEGGMGVVYSATDRRLNMPCAVKVLHANLAGSEERRAALLKEARILMTLRHPNIVGVYNVEQVDDTYCVVMELVEGMTLNAVLQQAGAFAATDALNIITRMLDGMHAAHKAGVVHRDLKPDNVLVTPEGDVRIIDFGIAKAPVHMGAVTKTGVVMGTWGYMAPEQGDAAKNADARSDVFSIGATLWALCKGKPPHNLYMSDQDASILAGLPQEIGAIVERACCYNPDDRYQTVEEMRAAVKSAKESMQEVVPKEELHEKPVVATPIVRHPSRLAGVLTAAVVIATIAAWTTWEKRGELFPATPTAAAVAPETTEIVEREPKLLSPVSPTVVEKTTTPPTVPAPKPQPIVEQQKTQVAPAPKPTTVEKSTPKARTAVSGGVEKSAEPRLVHKPVKTAKQQSVVTISVAVENAHTEDVVLYTRQKGGDAGWESTTMRGVNGKFQASITAMAPGVEYYIDAKSGNGETLKSGNRATPYVILVK